MNEVRLVYGVATAENTVAVGGVDTATELSALQPVVTGQYVAVLEVGGDRLILGAVGGQPPFCVATDDGTSIADSSTQQIVFDASVDPHSWVNAPGNIAPDVSGYYKVTCYAELPSSAATRVVCQIRKNSVAISGGIDNRTDPSSGASTVNAWAVVTMNGTSDVLDATLYQDSGGGVTPTHVELLVEWLGPN